MQIETGSYAEFSIALHAKAHPQRVPSNATIEITHRCPLTCAHCYNNLPMADGVARSREMSTEEHLRLLDELADLGCLWLLYTGGEIFARRDFLEIYTYAKKKGFLITLFTNGTMITESIADYLVEWRPFTMEITLYGGTRETYERMTGIPGSYDRCMRGIDLLLTRGLPLKLKTIATSITKHEIPAMRAMAERLGVEFTFDAMLNPRIDCSSSPLAVRLAAHEIVELDVRNPDRVAEWRRVASDFVTPVVPQDDTGPLYHCGGGVDSFAVDPYGDMTICVLSHVDKYNVRDGSLREGWEHFLRTVRERRAPRPTKCTNCGLRSMCGMCAANGELENGDPSAPVEFLCHVAHLRALTFGVDVRQHGECEYCPGGAYHDAVVANAAALRAKIGEEFLDSIPEAGAPSGAAEGSCGGGCSSCVI